MIQIEVMGPFSARSAAGPIAFGARSAAAVVALVALARGRPVTREAVATSIWPDLDPSNARTNLRKALQRVREALPEGELVVSGDVLSLDAAKVETDLDRAERLHRTYLLAARQPEGTAALADEWEIRRNALLDGWEDDWIEPYRTRAAVGADDLGIELARSYEATGDLRSALSVWRAILERVPHHSQALQSAIRLEAALNGAEQAVDLARHVRLLFRDELGIEMPADLRRVVRDYGMGALEPVPPPDFLRKRSELYLLARMFESNLQSNRGEALALLVREVTFEVVFAHPRTSLSLLTLALELTEGTSDDRLMVARRALVGAVWSSEFEMGHRWADFILGATPATDARHAMALNYKGGMAHEQRDFDAARACLVEAVRIQESLGNDDDAFRIRVSLASVQWHMGEYEPAIAVFREAATRYEDEEKGKMSAATAYGNLCFVYVAMGRWKEAVEVGRRCQALVAGESTVVNWAASAPFGFALFMTGARVEGLRLLRRSLVDTLREGLSRYNQIGIDYAVIALMRSGRERPATLLFHAAAARRVAIQHTHSPSELRLLRSAAGLDPAVSAPTGNHLMGQSAATLSEWTCEELDRLLARESAD